MGAVDPKTGTNTQQNYAQNAKSSNGENTSVEQENEAEELADEEYVGEVPQVASNLEQAGEPAGGDPGDENIISDNNSMIEHHSYDEKYRQFAIENNNNDQMN